MAQAAKGKSSSYGWVVLVVTFIAGFTAPANMAKAPALAPTLIGTFGLDPSSFGYLISVFFLLGFLLAFPAAAIIRKIGLRIAISCAVGFGAVGSLLGAFTATPELFGGFIVGRLLEGAGMGIMGVAGASAITPWFPKEKRGTPLGIWAVWVAAGMVVCPMLYSWMFAEAPAGLGLDLSGIWLVVGIFDVVALVLFNLLYRQPEVAYDDAELEGTQFQSGVKHKITDIFKSKALIALGLIFLFDEMAFMTINGFFVDYQVQTFFSDWDPGLAQLQANIFVTAFAVSGAICAPLAGKISDFVKSRKWVLFVGLCAGIIYTAVVMTNQIWELYWPIVIVAGMTGGMVPSIIWIATPETVPGDLVPSANAFVATTQNFGMFIGPMIMGIAIQFLGYGVATLLCLVPLYIICMICWVVGLRKTIK